MLKFRFTGHWATNGGGYYGFNYILTHPDGKNSKRLVNAQSVNSCREYYVRALRERINSGDSYIPIARKAYALISLGNHLARALPEAQAVLNTAAEKSLYILNSFEKHHKWQRTRIYPVECENMPLSLIFFSGPRRWTMSPYLMSMWAQMVRLGRSKWLPKRLMKLSHEDLVRQLAITSKGAEQTGDAFQLWRTIHEWDIFMSIYKDMFGSENRKYHWDKSHLHGGNDRPEGILKLMNGSTYYKELHRKYKELKKGAKKSK